MASHVFFDFFGTRVDYDRPHTRVATRPWHSRGALGRSIGAPVLANGAIEILIGEYLDTWTESVSPAQHALECITDLATDHRLTIVSNTHDPALVPRLVQAFGLHTSVEGPRAWARRPSTLAPRRRFARGRVWRQYHRSSGR